MLFVFVLFCFIILAYKQSFQKVSIIFTFAIVILHTLWSSWKQPVEQSSFLNLNIFTLAEISGGGDSLKAVCSSFYFRFNCIQKVAYRIYIEFTPLCWCQVTVSLRQGFRTVLAEDTAIHKDWHASVMPQKKGGAEWQKGKCCPPALVLLHCCTDSWKSKANAIVLIIMIFLRWHLCGREIEALQSPSCAFLARHAQPLSTVFKATKCFQQMHCPPHTPIIFIHFICSYGSVGKISKFLNSHREYLHPWSEIQLCHSGMFLNNCTWQLSHNSIHSGI